jgi:hypothetical protein
LSNPADDDDNCLFALSLSFSSKSTSGWRLSFIRVDCLVALESFNFNFNFDLETFHADPRGLWENNEHEMHSNSKLPIKTFIFPFPSRIAPDIPLPDMEIQIEINTLLCRLFLRFFLIATKSISQCVGSARNYRRMRKPPAQKKVRHLCKR